MRAKKWLPATSLCLALALVGCDCGGEGEPDASGGDATVADAGRTDTAVVDTATADTAVVDSARADAAVADTVVVDTAIVDTTAVDTTGVDTTIVDSASVDTGVADAAVEDVVSSEDGSTSVDAAPPVDAATAEDASAAEDGGASEDGGTSCVTIAELRAMPDGLIDVVTCPAYVTYLRFIGFYIQEVREGPAIMIFTGSTIDPAQDLGLAIGDLVTLRVTQLATVNGNRSVTWNGASEIRTVDHQGYDVSTHLAQDLSAGVGTAIGEDQESELVVLDSATVVSGGGREYVVSYGTGSVTADLYLYEGSLCVGAVIDLVSGYVQDYDGSYTIRSYYASDIAIIDDSGCPPDAVVRVNEVKANVNQGCDLVELRVIQGGSMTGFTVYERNVLVLTFASMAVATNDYIVLHFNADNTATCNPMEAYSEFVGKDQRPAATFTQNFDSAFDIQLDSEGITATSTVITVLNSTGGIVDAVLLTNGTSDANAASEAQAEVLRAAGEWLKADGTAASANFFVDPNYVPHAVPDLDLEGTSDQRTGNTIQRLDDSDTNKAGDWTSTNASPTWGANNVGQSDLP